MPELYIYKIKYFNDFVSLKIEILTNIIVKFAHSITFGILLLLI